MENSGSQTSEWKKKSIDYGGSLRDGAWIHILLIPQVILV